jgi:hypothetical protein
MVPRAVRLQLDGFGRRMLEEEAHRRRASTDDVIEAAALYYMLDMRANRLTVRVPRLERSAPVGNGAGPVWLGPRLDAEAWGALEREAARQCVPLERLLEHLILYYLADVERSRSDPSIRSS